MTQDLATIGVWTYYLKHPFGGSGYLWRRRFRFLSGTEIHQLLNSDGVWRSQEASRDHHQRTYTFEEAKNEIAWLALGDQL